MERLGNYLKHNLPELQGRIEEKLDVKLGKIDVQPLPGCVDEWVAFADNCWPVWTTSLRAIGTGLSHILKAFYMVAKAGESTIYYSRSPINQFESERDMVQIGLHELVHIALDRLAGVPVDEVKIPHYIEEGFATYVAKDIIQDMGFKPTGLLATGCYLHYRHFSREISERALTDFLRIKEFVLSVQNQSPAYSG